MYHRWYVICVSLLDDLLNRVPFLFITILIVGSINLDFDIDDLHVIYIDAFNLIFLLLMIESHSLVDSLFELLVQWLDLFRLFVL